MLDEQPRNIIQGELIAHQINKVLENGDIRRLEDGPVGSTPIMLGDDRVGQALDAPIRPSDPWPVVGIADFVLAQVAHGIAQGNAEYLAQGASLAISPIGANGDVGPVHRSVGSRASNRARGAFTIHPIRTAGIPDYPALWAHDAARERQLQIEPDAEGQIRDPSEAGRAAANAIWRSASRVHYNSDLQFNAQSIAVALTPANTLGGRAWPSILLNDPEHRFAFSLFCNSTLGLLMHWWASNKTQAGRGTLTVTTIAGIPTLDLRALAPEQHRRARKIFDDLRHYPFLPFDQIDEDVCRHELDRRLLVDVLGFPPETCEPDGPIDILRRKLAAEPQIHGGKKSRIEFVHPGGETPINPAPAPPPPAIPINRVERGTAR